MPPVPAAGVKRIVFGGSTLRGNPALTEILMLLCAGFGREPLLLESGEFAGALGALELASRAHSDGAPIGTVGST